MRLQEGNRQIVQVFILEPNVAAGNCRASLAQDIGEGVKRVTALTSVGNPNLSTARAAANVLDPPPHIVPLYNGKSLQFEFLADALAVGVLQAPRTRVSDWWYVQQEGTGCLTASSGGRVLRRKPFENMGELEKL